VDIIKSKPTRGSSVADRGCLSRILILSIPDLGVPDPGSRTATNEKGEKLLFYLFL